jgi:conjugative relaxase-like TrwC/TraI family protein
MITARAQKNLRQAKAYFREHLLQGDYHSEGQSVAGEWYGKGVERLGLNRSSPVTQEAFVRLCDNRHPLTGAKLTVRTQKDRRVLYDFVLSAPKSVSILAETMGDERLVAAHDVACRRTISELEKVAGCRIRKKGQRATRITGELVAASFRHDCSRAQDPQLHTHLVAFNATWDEVEKRWKALEPEKMYAQTTYLTEVYRNALASEVIRLGYVLRPARHGFEIEGVSNEIIERFSKRSRVIRDAETKLAVRLGQPLTNNGRAALAHSTRARKQRDVGQSELVAAQQAQLSGQELSQLRGLVQRGSAKPASLEMNTPEVVVAALAFARDHVFERLSVVPEHELLRHALAFRRGEVTLEALGKALALDPEFIQKGGEVTTREAVARERQLIALVNRGIGVHPKLCREPQPNARLTEEQRHAVATILRSTDGVVCLRGGAGTGKTTTLKEIARALSSPDREIAVFAPSAGAVEVLREEGFQRVDTLQRLLVDPQMQTSLRGQVLIVDEAGALSVGQLHTLLEVSRTQKCRVILSGDTRQHSSVEAGDGLRLLEENSQIQTVALKNIRRQVSTEYREAIAEVAKGQGLRGLALLERLGAVCELRSEERYAALAKDYLASTRLGKSALIVSPTWKEIQKVNQAVRAGLIEEGRLTGKPEILRVVKSEQWTKAQRRDFTAYRADHVLLFHRDTRDFARGQLATVVARAKDSVVVAGPNGKPVTLTRKQSDCYEVGTHCPLEVQSGEQLLIQGNRREAELLNGQIVTVQQVDKHGAIKLIDGRLIPPDFRQFTHGYCVTSPTSQGKTTDHVFVAMDSASGVAANRKQFYVSASRGREEIKIYTDDLRFLRGAVEEPGDRLLASEWLKTTQAIEQAARPAVTNKVRL